jgi:hypothetical protein
MQSTDYRCVRHRWWCKNGVSETPLKWRTRSRGENIRPACRRCLSLGGIDGCRVKLAFSRSRQEAIDIEAKKRAKFGRISTVSAIRAAIESFRRSKNDLGLRCIYRDPEALRYRRQSLPAGDARAALHPLVRGCPPVSARSMDPRARQRQQIYGINYRSTRVLHRALPRRQEARLNVVYS